MGKAKVINLDRKRKEKEEGKEQIFGRREPCSLHLAGEQPRPKDKED